jgi:hypothetical protein
MTDYNMSPLYYYRWGKENIGIVSDSRKSVREIMEILNKAQFGKDYMTKSAKDE